MPALVVAGIFGAYGMGEHVESIKGSAAVMEVSKDCTRHIAQIGDDLKLQSAQAVSDAAQAAASVAPVPDDQAGLIALCKASASCRERTKQ